jgi:hypothetical protein
MSEERPEHEDGSTHFSTPQARERLRDAIQAEAIDVNGKPTVLYGFMVVAEFSTVEGGRWMSLMAADASASSLPRWQVESYGREAVRWVRLVESMPDESDDESGE